MIECFKIQLLHFKEGGNILDLRQGKSIFKIQCLKPLSMINPTIIEADPFLYNHKGKLYLFYESKTMLLPGVIKMICTTDLVHWSDPIVVLQESYHLSFPFVFEDEGRIYMIPETSDDKSIRLYEAENDDLNSFRFVSELVKDFEVDKWKVSFCDSIIHKKDGMYYLFTSRLNSEGINILELYLSRHLSGKYAPHPCSPIVCSNKVGRNAGRIMEYNGEVLRFSQDCSIRYGDNVSVSRITVLTQNDYREEQIYENIIPTDQCFYKKGGHHFSAAELDGGIIVATDAKEYHKLIGSRIVNKLIKKLGLSIFLE